MGLLSSLAVGRTGAVLRHVLAMAEPERERTLAAMAGKLALVAGVQQDQALSALREAVTVGEAALLDSADGRAVVFQDAAESTARGGA